MSFQGNEANVPRELKLLVPVTVHPDIFAWGAQCLRYSTATKHPDVKTDVIDLRYNVEMAKLWIELRSRFEHDVRRAVRSGYRRLQKVEPDKQYVNEHTFQSLAAFLLIAEDRPALPPAFGQLARLVARRGDEARAMVARLDALLRALLQPAANAALVVGISTYQYILLDSILLARRVRALFPEVVLLLGGDPLDLSTTREVLKNTWLDGCVIGPGEYALNDILTAVKEGADIRHASIPRFANQAFAANVEASLGQWNALLETRGDYDAVSGYHGVEWNASMRAIHVLGRRGCTWAACTFCQRMHVITKEHVFDPAASLMQQELARLLEEYHAGRLGRASHDAVASRSLYRSGRFTPVRDPTGPVPLFIRVDADDADVQVVIDLIAWLKDQVPAGKRVTFYSYTPARQMARPDVHRLVNLTAPRRLLLRFGVPIETLNPKTSRTMRKGVHPVDSIKAMKVAADCGAIYGGSYFLFYPLEALEDVRAECIYIDRSLHLLAGRYQPNIYIGSYRDTIGQDPAKYQIALETASDPLMTLLGMETGLDSTRRYKVLGGTRLAHLQNAYISIFWSLKEALTTSRGQRLSAIWRFARALPSWLGWMCLLRDFSYLRRFVLMLAVMVVPAGRIKLYLRGNEVIRERPRMLGGKWRRRLGDLELRMLRYLYQRRQVGDVLSEFKDSGKAQAVLDELLRLGLVVQYANLLISVVNDPEGLSQLARAEEAGPAEPAKELESMA